MPGVGERDLSREPCPDRIVDDLGGAFGMGCIGGFLWHFAKGARNSPRGEVMSGAMYSAKMRAPILGGNFAVWGGTFSCFDCSFQYMRNKEDHWNAIASGFCTGGMLAMRGGWRSATRNAVIGGVLLSVIEMVSMVITRKYATTPREQYEQQLEYEKMIQMQTSAANKKAEGQGGGGGSSRWKELLGINNVMPQAEHADVSGVGNSNFLLDEDNGGGSFGKGGNSFTETYGGMEQPKKSSWFS